MKEDIRRFIIDIITGLIVAVLIVSFGQLVNVFSPEIWITIGITFFVTAVPLLLLLRKRYSYNSFKKLGIIGLWRDERHFQKQKGVGFTDYCRKFIDEVPTGQKVRILGYDWVELFSDTTILDKHIFGSDNTSRLSFDVVLLESESPMAIEKRAWEMSWRIGLNNHLYPEGRGSDSLQRLRSKIQNCTTVAKIFADERPQYFKLKQTPTLLHFSALMSQKKVIGVIYNPPWKGKDTLIFEAVKLERKKNSNGNLLQQHYHGDFYGFIEGYLDAIWDEPNWRVVQVAEKVNE